MCPKFDNPKRKLFEATAHSWKAHTEDKKASHEENPPREKCHDRLSELELDSTTLRSFSRRSSFTQVLTSTRAAEAPCEDCASRASAGRRRPNPLANMVPDSWHQTLRTKRSSNPHSKRWGQWRKMHTLDCRDRPCRTLSSQRRRRRRRSPWGTPRALHWNLEHGTFRFITWKHSIARKSWAQSFGSWWRNNMTWVMENEGNSCRGKRGNMTPLFCKFSDSQILLTRLPFILWPTIDLFNNMDDIQTIVEEYCAVSVIVLQTVCVLFSDGLLLGIAYPSSCSVVWSKSRSSSGDVDWHARKHAWALIVYVSGLCSIGRSRGACLVDVVRLREAVGHRFLDRVWDLPVSDIRVTTSGPRRVTLVFPTHSKMEHQQASVSGCRARSHFCIRSITLSGLMSYCLQFVTCEVTCQKLGNTSLVPVTCGIQAFEKLSSICMSDHEPQLAAERVFILNVMKNSTDFCCWRGAGAAVSKVDQGHHSILFSLVSYDSSTVLLEIIHALVFILLS